jgi:hypothetical protein
MAVPFSWVAIAACGHIRTFAINRDAHVDGHYSTFVVFLLSDVKKQIEVTFHNYKLKSETKVSL